MRIKIALAETEKLVLDVFYSFAKDPEINPENLFKR